MKPNTDEFIIKEGDVKCIRLTGPLSITPLYWHHGTLHLTNQRLFIEYYDQRIPILSLFTGPKKREFEIPLTAIRKVGGAGGGAWGFTVGYETGGKLQFFEFKPELFSEAEGSGEWIPQICRVANVQRTDTVKALYELLSPKNIAILLIEFAIIAIFAIIIAVLIAWFVSLSSRHP
jgi:hypothetical protein